MGIALFGVAAATLVLIAGHTSRVEWALFILAFAAILPASLVGGRLLVETVRSEHDDWRPSALAGASVAAVVLAVVAARAIDALTTSSGTALLLLSLGMWAGGVLILISELRRDRSAARAMPRLLAGAPTWLAPALGAVLVVAAVLAVLSPPLLRPGRLGLSVVVGAALLAVYLLTRSIQPRRWVSIALDVGIVALVLLTVSDVLVYLQYPPFDTTLSQLGDGTHITPRLVQFEHPLHTDFYLAPTNDVLHGRAMLVDTFSQYGIGLFYFLAAWFKVAPLGYGPMALLVGALTAAQYAAAYVILRLAGCSRMLSTAALMAAVFADVFASLGSPAQFPSTGALRYGAGYALILLAVLGARRPETQRATRIASLLVLAVATVWSIETFLYTLVTFLAIAAFDAAAFDAPFVRRLRGFGRELGMAAASSVAAVIIFGLATRAFDGNWPDFDRYFGITGYYLSAALNLAEPWTPGLLVGALYFASAVILITLLWRRPAFVEQHLMLLRAAAALTAFGLVTFSYFVSNSHPKALPVVATPAIMVGCLFLTLVAERMPGIPRSVRLGSLAVAFWVVGLLAVFGWPDAVDKWPRTPLAQILPVGKQGGSIDSNVSRLWQSPPIDPRSEEAKELLDRHAPGSRPVVVLLEPELTVETLIRSRRVNALPITHPILEDIQDPEVYLPRLTQTIDRLRPGTPMLTQEHYLHPERLRPLPGLASQARPSQVQGHALLAIQERFRLREVDRAPGGLVLARLERRAPRP